MSDTTTLSRPQNLMRAAMMQGRKARDICGDNPPVGCVVTLNDVIVASGHTNAPGEHHAEAMALATLAGDLSKHTFYVTLEPCSFAGRTPSCAQSLIDRNVGRVVVAMIDPHPKNRGRGIAMLRNAGIEVDLGVLAEEVSLDLNPFLQQSEE